MPARRLAGRAAQQYSCLLVLSTHLAQLRLEATGFQSSVPWIFFVHLQGRYKGVWYTSKSNVSLSHHLDNPSHNSPPELARCITRHTKACLLHSGAQSTPFDRAHIGSAPPSTDVTAPVQQGQLV